MLRAAAEVAAMSEHITIRSDRVNQFVGRLRETWRDVCTTQNFAGLPMQSFEVLEAGLGRKKEQLRMVEAVFRLGLSSDLDLFVRNNTVVKGAVVCHQ